MQSSLSSCLSFPAPQVLLKWNVQRGVPVIPKAGSEPHLAENIEGLFAWRLTWDQKVGCCHCLFLLGSLQPGALRVGCFLILHNCRPSWMP